MQSMSPAELEEFLKIHQSESLVLIELNEQQCRVLRPYLPDNRSGQRLALLLMKTGAGMNGAVTPVPADGPGSFIAWLQ